MPTAAPTATPARNHTKTSAPLLFSDMVFSSPDCNLSTPGAARGDNALSEEGVSAVVSIRTLWRAWCEGSTPGAAPRGDSQRRLPLLGLQHLICNAGYFQHGRHLMHADDVGAVQNRRRDGGGGSKEALLVVGGGATA